MIKKKFLFFLFLLPFVLISANSGKDGDSYTIKGQLIESENEQAVSYATLRVLQHDSIYVAGTRSGDDGTFQISLKELGHYLVAVECVGFETFYEKVLLDKNNPSADLGTLVLQPHLTLLKDMEVTANRKQITMRGDTLVFDAEAFRVPPGSTLGTLLSRLPGVTIEDGKLMYHGKEVNKLLINGKEFFAGDLSIALENLPTEIVENILAYETKTDEDKQKNTDSGERLNILDITIKKEYMSTWIGNMDLAVGTGDHYSERVFVTRFTDKLSLSAYGQINNLNDQSEASPNGGWSSNNWQPGRNTFRKMGVNAAWDNGKKEDEDGYLKLSGNVRASHNNINAEQEEVGENFYPGSSHSYTNNVNGRRESSNNVDLEARVDWRIDSLTNMYTKLNYGHNDQHATNYSRTATFNANPYEIPGVVDPIVSVFQENPLDSLIRVTVNRNQMNSLRHYNSNTFSSQFFLGRRVHKKGHRLNMWATFQTSKNNTTHSALSDIRYFNEDAEEPRRINNQHSLSPSSNRNFFIEMMYEHVLSPKQRLLGGAGYATNYSQNDYTLYQLDSLDSWRNTDHPVGSLPSADSLAMAINWQNSTYATYDRSGYGGFIQYRLMDKNQWSVTLATNFTPYRTRMEYQRDRLDTTVVDNRIYVNPYAWVKYKFKGEGQITLQYYGYRDYPELTQMLDITDDRNPLYVIHGNPDLKASWNQGFRLNFQTAWGERKTSVWANAGYHTSDTRIVNTETYDPVTGIRVVRPENVDGSWNTYANTGTNIPIGAKSRLNFSPGFYFYYRHSVGSFRSTEDLESQLNNQNNYGFTPRINLNYRLDRFYIGTNNSISFNMERSSLQPESDQTSRIFSTGINGQYEFTWGTTLASDFGLYSCRGFSSPTMNNDQWLWNASISQSFLKKKTLLVVVEARDILGQKLSQWSNSNAYSRTTYHSNMFRDMNYIMTHLIYRFSIGKKAT